MAKRRATKRASERDVDNLTDEMLRMLGDLKQADATKALAMFAEMWKRIPRAQAREYELLIAACAMMGEILTAFANGFRDVVSGRMPDVQVGREIEGVKVAAAKYGQAIAHQQAKTRRAMREVVRGSKLN